MYVAWLLLALCHTPMQVKPLNGPEWVVCIALGAVAIPVSFGVRLAGRAWRRRAERRAAAGAAHHVAPSVTVKIDMSPAGPSSADAGR